MPGGEPETGAGEARAGERELCAAAALAAQKRLAGRSGSGIFFNEVMTQVVLSFTLISRHSTTNTPYLSIRNLQRQVIGVGDEGSLRAAAVLPPGRPEGYDPRADHQGLGRGYRLAAVATCRQVGASQPHSFPPSPVGHVTLAGKPASRRCQVVAAPAEPGDPQNVIPRFASLPPSPAAGSWVSHPASARGNGTDDANLHLPHQNRGVQARGRDAADGRSELEPGQMARATKQSENFQCFTGKGTNPNLGAHSPAIKLPISDTKPKPIAACQQAAQKPSEENGNEV